MNLRGPLYQYIEFCNDPEALWGKLQSGHWDWLGLKRDERTFVLGRPRLNLEERMVGTLGAVTSEQGAQEGQHGTILRLWNGSPSQPQAQWFVEPERASASYEQLLERLDTPEQAPLLAWVTLILNGFPEDKNFIVHLLAPNYWN